MIPPQFNVMIDSAMLTDPDWKAIKKRVIKIVSKADLASLSARGVRELLTETFGDLTAHKKKLNKIIAFAVESVSEEA